MFKFSQNQLRLFVTSVPFVVQKNRGLNGLLCGLVNDRISTPVNIDNHRFHGWTRMLSRALRLIAYSIGHATIQAVATRVGGEPISLEF